MTFHLWKPWKKVILWERKSWKQLICMRVLLSGWSLAANYEIGEWIWVSFTNSEFPFLGGASPRHSPLRPTVCAAVLLRTTTSRSTHTSIEFHSIPATEQKSDARPLILSLSRPYTYFFSVSEEWVIKHQNWHKMNIFTVQLWNFRSCFKITVACAIFLEFSVKHGCSNTLLYMFPNYLVGDNLNTSNPSWISDD